MRSQLEGSQAVAQVVARCRPQVIPAYPITPQTHIVEAIGDAVRKGKLENARYMTVESEFGAMSAAIGASAAGSRAYTATASQGLLFMVEALYNAGGLGLPIVMTVANRAIGAPINIWNDQSDAMSQRDCGWVQLYAPDNQAAVDLHPVAFRLAEELSVPVMVCVDGFVLTHAFEPIDIPEQSEIDEFLPAYRPRQVLDVNDPVSIGAMVGPEAFTEVRYLSHHELIRAQEVYPRLMDDYQRVVGRSVPAVECYRTEGADTVVVALGSVTGTLKDVVDELAVTGRRVGLVGLTMFRPFPYGEVATALAGAGEIIVLERAFAPGADGIVTGDVRTALACRGATARTVVAGLGGRAIGKAALHGMLADAAAGTLPGFSFLELREDLVDAELERLRNQRMTGPQAVNVLRQAGQPASRIS